MDEWIYDLEFRRGGVDAFFKKYILKNLQNTESESEGDEDGTHKLFIKSCKKDHWYNKQLI